MKLYPLLMFRYRRRYCGLLKDIRDEFKLTLLFITHDLRVAAQICDSVMVMSKGEIMEYGATKTIFESPQHPYTQRAIRRNSRPCILVRASVGDAMSTHLPADPMATRSFAQYAAELRSGTLSALSVVETYLERIRQLNPKIDAISVN